MRPVNLIPQEQRRRTPSEGSGRRAHAVLGVLAVLLGLVVAYVLTSNKVTERQNQTAAAGAEAGRLEAEAGKAANYTDFAQVAATRLQAVAGVARTRFDWERFMRELSLIMPEDSWLQSADASATGDTAADGPAATASSGTSTATAAGPSANLVGCTPRPPDVARMMVRLRQLHRVSDVSLNESSREQGSTPATVDSCGSFYSFDLTVSFDQTGPGNEAPRGAARVPASLGGGS
jgi:Tfp pilus assembly protein PilN